MSCSSSMIPSGNAFFARSHRQRPFFKPNSSSNKSRSSVVGPASTDGAERRAHDELQARDGLAQDTQKRQAHDLGRPETKTWRQVVAIWRTTGGPDARLAKFHAEARPNVVTVETSDRHFLSFFTGTAIRTKRITPQHHHPFECGRVDDHDTNTKHKHFATTQRLRA